MVNQYYYVEGIEVRLTAYRLFDDNQMARVFFAHRNYDIPYTDMPELMRHWIPVNEKEFITTYDHISAESDLKPADDSHLQVTANSTKEPSPREILTSMFIEQMPKDLLDIGKIIEAANNAILQLKSPVAGHSGQAFVAQANAIASLLDKVIKAKKLTIDEFNLALKISNIQAPKDPPGMKQLGQGDKD